MAFRATTLPILHGMTPRCLKLGTEVMGKRLTEYERSCERIGLAAVKAWVETTNSGDVLILYFEGEDVGRSLGQLASSKEPFDKWFRDELFDITGVDVGSEPNRLLYDLVYVSPELEHMSGEGSVATVFPVLPGKLDEWKHWLDTIGSDRLEDYRGYLERYALSRERFFLGKGHKGENMVILYAEGKEPAEAIARFARSGEPFDVWMREEMLYLNGIDFIRRTSAPKPTYVFGYRSGARHLAA